MEGGIGILLLLIIVVVVGGIIALYVTGGALLGGGSKGDKDADDHRPEHTRPTSPTQEKVTFAGTGQDRERDD